jgi:dipeptidyl peptidase IV (DPP IV)-like protein/uncharacterized protein DUF1731
VVDHIPYHQNLEVTPYPKAGDPNPIVQLGVVNAAGGATRWMDTYKYQPSDFLIVRVTWTPDSRNVVYQAQNREQTFLNLNFADAREGNSNTLLRESSPAWVEVIDNPTWLKDGSFLWQSERNGWRHLYHYSPGGKLLQQVTNGKWEVRSLEGTVNVVSPNPVTNAEFTKILGKVLARPTLFPIPEFGVRLAFGEMADALLLASQRVEPKRLKEVGYQFEYPELEKSLGHILRKSE